MHRQIQKKCQSPSRAHDDEHILIVPRPQMVAGRLWLRIAWVGLKRILQRKLHIPISLTVWTSAECSAIHNANSTEAGQSCSLACWKSGGEGDHNEQGIISYAVSPLWCAPKSCSKLASCRHIWLRAARTSGVRARGAAAAAGRSSPVQV